MQWQKEFKLMFEGDKKVQLKNEMQIQFTSQSINEGFARVAVGTFVSQLDPTVEELYDIKTAISEAVTNSIIHGYEDQENKNISIKCSYIDREITIEIIDEGKGIKDVDSAMTALYTTSKEEERAGLGFTVMQSMMDELEVFSELGKGTKVIMKRTLGSDPK